MSNKIKTGYIYVFTTDISDVYKIGRTINIALRKSSANTMLLNDIQILYQIKTYCPAIAEKHVHKMLYEFRVSNRELFKTDLNRIIKIVEDVVQLINEVHTSIEIQAQKTQNNMQTDDPMGISKFSELHLMRQPGAGVNWTELYECYQEWHQKTYDNVILDKKKVKMYFENHIFKKTVIPVSNKIGRGWCGWTLIK